MIDRQYIDITETIPDEQGRITVKATLKLNATMVVTEEVRSQAMSQVVDELCHLIDGLMFDGPRKAAHEFMESAGRLEYPSYDAFREKYKKLKDTLKSEGTPKVGRVVIPNRCVCCGRLTFSEARKFLAPSTLV